MNCTVIDKYFEMDAQYAGRIPKYNVIVQDNATGNKYTINNQAIFYSADKEFTMQVTTKYSRGERVLDTIFKEIEKE